MRPIPAQTSTEPSRSIGVSRRSSGGCERTVSASATSATGTLIQKIDRQVHSIRKPPASGPTEVSAPVIAKKIASARPRSCAANDAAAMASAAGNRSAPNAP